MPNNIAPVSAASSSKASSDLASVENRLDIATIQTLTENEQNLLQLNRNHAKHYMSQAERNIAKQLADNSRVVTSTNDESLPETEQNLLYSKRNNDKQRDDTSKDVTSTSDESLPETEQNLLHSKRNNDKQRDDTSKDVTSTNSEKLTEEKLTENELIGYEATLASYLDERGKKIAKFQKPRILPMPSSLSYVSSFFYSETDFMQQLQKEVNNYNKLLKASALDDELQPLTNLFDCPVSDSDVTKHLDTLSIRVTQLSTALKAVEHAFQNLTETERNHAKQFGDILSLEIDLISKNETLIDDYQAAWKTNSDGYKHFHQFYSSCSPELQSTMTPELKRLCFDLVAESESLDKKELAQRLPNKLAQYASAMSIANLRILSEILAEKMPELADDVTTAFPKAEQKAQLGAILLITQALNQSQKQLSIESDGIDERLNLSGKLASLHHNAAVFEDYFKQFIEMDAHQDDQFVATLWAITGQEWSIAKNDTLIPDELNDYDDLNLSNFVKHELRQSFPSDETRQLAENVIQAQHRVSWLDDRNTITFELNNHGGVDLYADLEDGRLVDNLSQNLPRYSDYIEEKLSALESYVSALQAFLPRAKLVGSETTRQVESAIKDTKIQRDHFNDLKVHCDAVEQVLDAKVLLSDKLARVDIMLDNSIVSIRQRLNLQGFLTFLPSLRTNNEKVTELVNERNELQSGLDNQELTHLKPKIDSLNADIQLLDYEYERQLLELTRFDRKIKQEKGYPGDSGNSLESWSAWVKQNVAGSLSGDYRPDMSMLILERQMAKAGISGYTEAYQSLFVSLRSGQIGISHEGVKKALVDLHRWAMHHPIESQALAGNLNHVFQIVSSNGGFFGSDAANMATTIWSTGTVESRVKDILQGRREFLPNQESLSMTPEMIALLHLAQSAPYMAAAMKGLAGGGLMANGAGLLVSTLVPGVAVAQPMARILGGIVQTWSEKKAANIVTQHRTTEVMVNALMRGIISQGSFKDRAQAMAVYTMQRQALQDVGTLSRDCVETNKTGMIRRAWQDAKNTWSEMNWKARAFTVATTVALSIGAAAVAVIGVISIVGTGGIAIAIAAMVGLGAMSVGGFFARTTINLIAASNFLGMNDANERAREKMTQQRIDDALKRVEEKTNNSRLAELLGDSIKNRGKSLNFSNLPIDQQDQALEEELINAARISDEKLDSQYKQTREKEIASAETLTGATIERNKWYECYDDVQKSMAKYAAMLAG
ncbi:hypothetical protein [Vibrio pectenicida]|uniref:Secreted effector protein SptP N-terminal domain-containing protein n=1 Tax=Vibrio pectenicida TaxID=62763 RepID=A0A3R9F515_9VIBR|nr:hypothetical protein [Vibrio pectenicida]RSD29158.1 hypothetical protein EJA03_18435 [Vibrio pectenicida]